MSFGRKNPGHDVPVSDVLKDYELRFRMMADNVSMGMFQVTAGDDSRILYANPALARMLGYNGPEDLSGKFIKELLIHSTDLGTIIDDVRKDRYVNCREIRLKHREGSEIWVSVQAWKLKAHKNPVIEGFIEDVTENKVFSRKSGSMNPSCTVMLLNLPRPTGNSIFSRPSPATTSSTS